MPTKSTEDIAAVSTITSKYQITVPREVRDELGLRAGDKLQWVKTPQGITVRRRFDRKRAEKWIGYLKDPDLIGRDSVEIVREMRGD